MLRISGNPRYDDPTKKLTALGHSSVVITADLYMHVALAMLRSAADSLSALIGIAAEPAASDEVVPSRAEEDTIGGGPGRIRTYAQPVMSRPLYR